MNCYEVQFEKTSHGTNLGGLSILYFMANNLTDLEVQIAAYERREQIIISLRSIVCMTGKAVPRDPR